MQTRRSFGAGLLALGLAGCGSRAAAPPPGAPVPAADVRVLPPRFGDADPHDWGRDGPQRLAVHGIDVSRYQPSIDWGAARAAGVNFAWIKATEGGDRVNPLFDQQWRGAASAGVLRGAFHFYYFCTDPDTQAAWFIRNVPADRGSLPPVVDLEWNPYSPTCVLRPPAADVRRVAGRFISLIEARYGQRPVIYTTIDFFEQNQLWLIPREEFWLRSVAAHPADRYRGVGWRFWQYSGTGLVPGIAGKVDLNAFEGSEAEWRAWLGRRLV